ncbi:PadR family transcriptional regulator PadR [Paraburkholderia fungorum]|jgi:PadR family transcriptional regulator PadR|nr:PadR family transcriptional regulator PadR [Paraburkholderia fungorum]
MKTQIKKGTLDMCVLAVLAGGDSYAYELVSTLSETMEISEGTIYPLMRRLQAEAWCRRISWSPARGRRASITR